jgi:hypothetical protein
MLGDLVQNRRSESSAEQLQNFRENADDARRSAASSPNPAVREAYEELAAAWELLIREVESNP